MSFVYSNHDNLIYYVHFPYSFLLTAMIYIKFRNIGLVMPETVIYIISQYIQLTIHVRAILFHLTFKRNNNDKHTIYDSAKVSRYLCYFIDETALPIPIELFSYIYRLDTQQKQRHYFVRFGIPSADSQHGRMQNRDSRRREKMEAERSVTRRII